MHVAAYCLPPSLNPPSYLPFSVSPLLSLLTEVLSHPSLSPSCQSLPLPSLSPLCKPSPLASHLPPLTIPNPPFIILFSLLSLSSLLFPTSRRISSPFPLHQAVASPLLAIVSDFRHCIPPPQIRRHTARLRTSISMLFLRSLPSPLPSCPPPPATLPPSPVCPLPSLLIELLPLPSLSPPCPLLPPTKPPPLPSLSPPWSPSPLAIPDPSLPPSYPPPPVLPPH